MSLEKSRIDESRAATDLVLPSSQESHVAILLISSSFSNHDTLEERRKSRSIKDRSKDFARGTRQYSKSARLLLKARGRMERRRNHAPFRHWQIKATSLVFDL